MGSHYEGVPRRGPVARCEVPAAAVGPLGPVVTSSAEEPAVLVQTPRDLHDARRNSARVLGAPQAGRGAVSQASSAADWLTRRWGAGLGAVIPDGTLKL